MECNHITFTHTSSLCNKKSCKALTDFLPPTAVSPNILSIIWKNTSLVQWRNASSVAGTQQFLGALVFSLNQTFLFSFDLEDEYRFLKMLILI